MKRGIWIHPRDFEYETPKELAEKLSGFDIVYYGPIDELKEIENLQTFMENFTGDTYLSTPLASFQKIWGDIGNEIGNIKSQLRGIALDIVRFDNWSWWNIFRTKEITKLVEEIVLKYTEYYKVHLIVKSGWYQTPTMNYLYALKWGVDYKVLATHCDAICPMIYTELYGLPQDGKHVLNASKWLQNWTGKCEPIIQTYYDPTESPMKKPTKWKLNYEINQVKKAGCEGYSQFRYRKDWEWQL